MKIKLSILFFLTFLIGTVSFAQRGDRHSPKYPILVDESGIKSITATNNIDLLLLNTSEGDVKAKVRHEKVNKLKIAYSNGNLKLSANDNLEEDERIQVYVYVNNLENLTLTGNSFATSRDILDLYHLVVNIEDEARVALRTKGKIKINAPDSYRRIEEQRFYLLLSTE